MVFEQETLFFAALTLAFQEASKTNTTFQMCSTPHSRACGHVGYKLAQPRKVLQLGVGAAGQPPGENYQGKHNSLGDRLTSLNDVDHGIQGPKPTWHRMEPPFKQGLGFTYGFKVLGRKVIFLGSLSQNPAKFGGRAGCRRKPAK